MASFDQPLLGQPKRSIPLCRALLFTLSVVSLLSFAALVAIHLASSNHFAVCANAKIPSSCLTLVSREVVSGILPMSQIQLLQILLKRSVSGVITATQVTHRLNLIPSNGFFIKQQAGLSDCLQLLDLSRDLLEDSSMALRSLSKRSHSDAHSWLSAVLTNYDTCLDGLQGTAKSMMKAQIQNLMALASTSLAIVNSFSPLDAEDQLLEPLNGEYPFWVTSRDRKLLESYADAIAADVVVAKDGSGKYKTIQEAVDTAPDKSKTRYVIHVKKGTYKEQVQIGKNKKNIMLAGDGMDSTIITGSLNVVDGSTTFNSATLVAVGEGFIAQDLQIQNTAGPKKGQAVALRVGADKSVINRCKLDAYQDTLYPHSLRQFFRDCSVTGTVDFIFGNSAVVFQNCKIIARKPGKGQGNMVTAQGRTDPNQNTGTSIQNCNVIPSPDLIQANFSVKSYLGRPWKEFSRTVYMQSFIDNHIDPSGWSPWSGDFALKTLYYGEYSNRGPGAGTSKRVTWPGYHVITDPKEAKKFTVKELIQGDQWLPSTGVSYTEGL
ncbi:pectinesterase 2.1-like [Aristolochia californica]|uniref:pectinesterase 2.1-like n=1 Tax=Aristolochia californica TaxID=171875 RepID=UPI0035E3BCD4